MQEFDRQANRIREKIKRFNTESLFLELFKYVQSTTKIAKDGGIAAPWLALLAIDWVFELSSQSGIKRAKASDAHSIVQMLWDIQSIAIGGNAAPIPVQIRALFGPQIKFQGDERKSVFLLLRVKKIIDSNPHEASGFKDSFFAHHKVEFDTFYEIAFFLCVTSMRQSTFFIPYSVLAESLIPHYKLEDFVKALKVLSSTLGNLIKQSARERDRTIPATDYLKESIFLVTPFLLSEKGLHISHPRVAMVGVSESIIRSFIRGDERNRLAFTRCFEEYVNKIHEEMGISAIREDALIRFYEANSAGGRKVIDFLRLDTPNKSVFIDAKGIEPTNAALSATTRFSISRRVKQQHIRAIEQIIDTIAVLSENSFEGLASIENRFGIVVTHQDFFLGTGDRILEFFHETISRPLVDLAENKILFSNIHFMTVEQYEQLNRINSETGSTVPDFLEYVNHSQSVPEKARMMMEQYLGEFSKEVYAKNYLPNGSKSLVHEKDCMFEKAIAILEKNHDYWRQVGKLGDQGIAHFLQTSSGLKRMLLDDSDC